MAELAESECIRRCTPVKMGRFVMPPGPPAAARQVEQRPLSGKKSKFLEAARRARLSFGAWPFRPAP